MGSALSLAQRTGVLGPENGRPLAMKTEWSSVWIDGALHRTYWVESWPRRPVPAGWLQSFLVAAESMSMTVIHRPVDPARSQRYPGMGLGLAIVKSIMELHGGMVTAQSVPRQGTTITLQFHLPAEARR